MDQLPKLSKGQVDALHQIERDMHMADCAKELAADRATLHAILTAIEDGPRMDTIDLMIAFEQGDLDDESVINLFQTLINDGTVDKLEGFYGRMAKRLIEAGYCTEPQQTATATKKERHAMLNEDTRHPMNAVCIDTDGTTCITDLGREPLIGMYKAIDCTTVDVVRLAPDLHMWVDDEGMLKDGVEVNLVATVIADVFGRGGQPYYGGVVFTGGADEEGETQPISAERAAMLAKWAARILEHKGDMAEEEENAQDPQ